MSILMEEISQMCPLLSLRMDQSSFLERVQSLASPLDSKFIESMGYGGVFGSWPVKESHFWGMVHLPFIESFIQDSQITWFPWDEQRPDRVKQLHVRIDARKLRWAALYHDAKCITELHHWLRSKDEEKTPGHAIRRVASMLKSTRERLELRGAIASVDQGGETAANITLRLYSELESLISYLESKEEVIPPNASLPSAPNPQKDWFTTTPQSLFASPDFSADPTIAGNFITQRDHAILWRDWGGLLGIYEGFHALFEENEESNFRWRDAMATLFEEGQLNEPDKALFYLVPVFEHAPETPQIQRRITKLYQQNQCWSELLELNEKRLSNLTNADAERDFLLLQRAELLTREFELFEDALEIFRDLSESNSEEILNLLCTNLFKLIEENFTEGSNKIEGLSILHDLWLTQPPQKLVELYLQALEEEDVEEEELLEFLLQLEVLQIRQGDEGKPELLQTLSKVFLCDPESEDVYVRLEALCIEMGKIEFLIKLLTPLMEENEEEIPKAKMSGHLGRLYRLLGFNEEALECLESAREVLDRDSEILTSLVELYQAYGRLAEAVITLEHLREITKEEDLDAISEIITLLKDNLKEDPEQCVFYFKEHIKDEPLESLKELRLLSLSGPLAITLETLKVLSEHFDEEERLALAEEIGEQVTALKTSTDRLQLIDALEHLLDGIASQGVEVAYLLCSCYWLDPLPQIRTRLLTLLPGEGVSEACEETIFAYITTIAPSRRPPALFVFGELLLEAGMKLEATALLEKVLHISPRNQEAFAALKTLYQERGDWRLLVGLYLRHAAQLSEYNSIQLSLEAASLLDKKLGEVKQAAIIYSEVLKIDPAEEVALKAQELLSETHPKGSSDIEELKQRLENEEDVNKCAVLLGELADLYLERGAAREADRVLAGAVKLSVEAPIRADIFCQMARISRHFKTPKQTEAYLKKALAIQPRDLKIVDRLIRFYRRESRNRQLLVMLKFRLAKSTNEDANKRAAILKEIANVAETQLDKPEVALEALQDILGLAEEHPGKGISILPVLHNIASLQIFMGDEDGGIRTLKYSLTTPEFKVSGPEMRASLHADLCTLHLGRGEKGSKAAIFSLKRAQNLTPDAPRLKILEIDIAMKRKAWVKALTLVELFRKASSGDLALTKLLLARLGSIHVNLGNQERASKAFKELLKLEPEHPGANAFIEQPEG